ncbi:MAG TPA: hypothetical protein VIY73_02875 [Polyangiaceae bacterium]
MTLLSPAAGRRQRRELMQQIARDQRRQQREHLVDLRAQVRQARADRHAAIVDAKSRCRSERRAVRERLQVLREQVLQELRETVAGERAAAKETCSIRQNEARRITDRIKRVRAELDAERSFQRDMRRIERANRHRTNAAHRATAAELRSQSDDEVRANIPDDLIPLWERVKRSIRGSDRKSRTEAFLQYAEEHPHEILEMLEDRTDALVQELEARERETARALRKPVNLGVRHDDTPPSSYGDDLVPF